MKSPFILLFFILLPYAAKSDYDESSTRRIKLEDIEDDRIQNERQSKSMPPPLSKQPAKGQPANLYTNEEYHNEYPSDTHRYSTRAHQHVQPLTDQPNPPPEADYQQSPAYPRETLVYLPANAHGQSHLQENDYEQQQPMMYDAEQQHQPSPHFYYSHDFHQHQPNGNDYQIQFIPIDQNGGSDEQQQHAYAGSSPMTVPSTAAPLAPLSYSHDVAYEGAQPEVQQHQNLLQYVTANEIREPNTLQQVYGLPADVLFQSQKDILYAKPAQTYGPPLEKFHKKPEYSQRDYSQDIPPPKPSPSYQPQAAYSDQIQSGGYESQSSNSNEEPSEPQPTQVKQQTEFAYTQSTESPQKDGISYGYETQTAQSILSPSATQTADLSHQKVLKYEQGGESDSKENLSYGYETELAQSSLPPSETQTNYLNHQKQIRVAHQGAKVQKPAITYGPPDTVGQSPKIEYGAPDAPFRRPVAQSNQDIYAPRRPASSARSNEKPFAVSYPYPPSFVSITTESYAKSTAAPELHSNNDVTPWRPLPSPSKYRSLGPVQEPLIDFFHSRHAKSLLDSYIPSWQVTQMQREHSRQIQQSNSNAQRHQIHNTPQSYIPEIQQTYAIPSLETENNYNTVSYSSPYENIYGNQFKRSTQKKHQKKKILTSNKEVTAMA